eukprot:gene4103-11868_t
MEPSSKRARVDPSSAATGPGWAAFYTRAPAGELEIEALEATLLSRLTRLLALQSGKRAAVSDGSGSAAATSSSLQTATQTTSTTAHTKPTRRHDTAHPTQTASGGHPSQNHGVPRKGSAASSSRNRNTSILDKDTADIESAAKVVAASRIPLQLWQ